MRILLAAAAALMLAGCSSILLGNATTRESGMSADHRSSSQIATDDRITAAVRQKLSRDSILRQYAIGISTIDSNVTLSGTVGSYPARDRAVQIASDTDGVKTVTSRIIVNTNL